MSKQCKLILVLAMIIALLAIALLLPSTGIRSSLAIAQETCEGDFNGDGDVDGSDLSTFAADFGRTDCPSTPAEGIPKTGQTSSYATGDDGDLEKGTAWPIPRFTDNGDGTVTDNLTGLIWLKKADCFGQKNWFDALNDCASLADGSCGLSDGSDAGDWRVPNIKELVSLIHYGVSLPVLPDTAGTGKWSEGDPFTGVWSYYWSSTTDANDTGLAWLVLFYFGDLYHHGKNSQYYVWCVRGGK